jgi:hypothetical protein
LTGSPRAEIKEDIPGSIVGRYLQKNVELKDFTESSFNVLVKVNVTKYIFVNKFQEVIEMEVS